MMGSTRGKSVVIHVLTPGGWPGLTSGDVIENPTAEQQEQARTNPGCLRIVKVSASKGGSVDREVEKHGRTDNTS